ncbi:MAG: DNA-deoxyinosine glycosylase [Gammaproteobacteria bacterium]|nr:DNA-deoxyinosine glycosylase [Gammaproteobacteria bacterium]
MLEGFPPIARRSASVLVLGSMPGAASLAAGEYYAHPRNQFWRITGTLCGFDAAAPYRRRVAGLRAADVALWDVIRCCVRRGSLDAAIEPASVRVNDFQAFLVAHPHIAQIFFNGSQAEQVWRRHVAPGLSLRRELRLRRLPSTSPAHAALSYSGKLRAWRILRAR